MFYNYSPCVSINIVIVCMILLWWLFIKNNKDFDPNRLIKSDKIEELKTDIDLIKDEEEKEEIIIDDDNDNICIKKNKFISKGEKICCETLNKIYGVPFINSRPKWLINPETNQPLELDCYNKNLKIAVEYNGSQHYNYPNYTNQNDESFINQIRRDKLKKELCEKNDVYLIVVPYTISHKKIPDYIISNLPDNIKEVVKNATSID